MEIIYRIYEITKNDTNNYWGLQKRIIAQEVCVCENREQFKSMIKEMYGNDISFRASKSLNVGSLVCTIISENCFNTNNYIKVYQYKCSHCNKEWLANGYIGVITLNKYLIEKESPTYYEENKLDIENQVFCCKECREIVENKYINEAIKFRQENDDIEGIWINKERFSKYNCGYIYMISKKSTKEFYVGQTNTTPIFRWGQHLLTDRFKIENIEDYIFEVLEIVNDKEKLLEREAYWINKKRNENPSLSLNIQIPKEKPISIFEGMETKGCE